MTRFLTVSEVIKIHERAINEAGGAQGVRDSGLVDSAVMRPQATFSGKQLYPDLFSKSAALLESLARNHAFVDGNKRTAYLSVAVFLEVNGYTLTASLEERFSFIIDVAVGKLDFAEISIWLKENSRAL